MGILATILGNDPETGLERAIDRYFFNQNMNQLTMYLLNPDKKKNELELKLLEKQLNDGKEQIKLPDDLFRVLSTHRRVKDILKVIT